MRGLGRLVVGALVAGGLAVPGVAAAATPLSLQIQILDCGVGGSATSGHQVRVELRSSGGALLDSATAHAQDSEWYVCLDRGVAVGNVVKAKDLQSGKVLTQKVPNISLVVDRVADMVSGVGPHNAKLWLQVGEYNFQPSTVVTRQVTTNGSGAYAYHFGSLIDIKGTTSIYATWTKGGVKPNKASVSIARWTSGPNIGVRYEASGFFGSEAPGIVTKVKVSTDGAVVASGKAKARADGAFFGTLQANAGGTYSPHGGETVRATSLASDARFVVPAVDGSVNVDTNVVSGVCFASSPYYVDIETDNGAFGYHQGIAAADGTIAEDMSSDIDIQSGDQVEIACFTPAGDVVLQDFNAA